MEDLGSKIPKPVIKEKKIQDFPIKCRKKIWNVHFTISVQELDYRECQPAIAYFLHSPLNHHLLHLLSHKKMFSNL